jgi:uncharacterized small protein (DUF1192 family)
MRRKLKSWEAQVMALEPDELDPRRPKAALRPLDGYSVEELHTYVRLLHAEIVRTEAAIAHKTAHRSAADAFFKRG